MFRAKAFTSLCISGRGSAVCAAGAWSADHGLLDWLTVGLVAFFETPAISLGLRSVLGKKLVFRTITATVTVTYSCAARIARLPIELCPGNLVGPGSLREALMDASLVIQSGLGDAALLCENGA